MKPSKTKQTWIVRNGKKAFMTQNRGKEKLKDRGNELYWLMKNLVDDSNQTFDTSKGKFWIVKNHPTLSKGQRIFDPVKAKQAEKVGNLRPITFPRNNWSMEVARAVSRTIDLTLPNQHGFTKDRNIYTALEPHRNNSTFVTFDGSSAFNTIEENTVYYIFRNVFDLNKEHSKILTDLATENGYLYQGCPYSPQIWNIYQWHMMDSLAKIKDITATSYADDLIISTKYEYMGWSFRKALIRIISDSGMKVNNDKTRFSHIRENTQTYHRQLGLIMVRKNGVTKIRPKHRAKLKRKMRYFWKMKEKGLVTTKRLSDKGNFITLKQVIMGLKAWFLSEPDWQEIDREKSTLQLWYKKKRAEKLRFNISALNP